MNLTLDKAQALAPDANTLQRAERLANPRKWITVECDERALWGECSGSGAEPYRAIVDLNGPAYKCTCPVKRFPCKHTLALLLMAAEGNPQNFGKNTQPTWVSDWLTSRDRRATAKAEPKTEEQIARSEASKEKNWQERLEMMSVGVANLQRRLLDIIRGGLAELATTSPQFWTDFAARLVDAKLGGLSKKVKSFAHLQSDFPDTWHEILASELGSLYLLTKAFQNFDKLSEGLQNDIMILSGVTVKKEELLQQTGVKDHWLVLGQIDNQEEDNLTSRRVWLYGKDSQKTALILDFAFGNQGFPSAWLNGQVYESELVFYPSAYPQRAIVKTIEMGEKFSQIIGYQNFTQFLNNYAKAIASNPWLAQMPVLLSQVIPVFKNKNFTLIDTEKKCLPTEGGDNKDWKLISLSGGQPIAVFGEWNGRIFIPLTAIAEGRMIDLK